MSVEEAFETAQKLVKELPRTPAPNELLELYGWYKQATLGDASGSRPGVLDFKGRAKFDAWAACRGTPTEVAMQSYVKIVERLCRKYG